ncbi:MAG: putative quinol monooxygenase [Pseudomonadota bacterium]
MSITKLVFIRAKKGYEEALGRLLMTLVEPSRAEPLCIDYDLHRAQDDPALWFIYQNWTEEQGFAAHLKKPALRACIRDARHMVEASMNMKPFVMLSQPVRNRSDEDEAMVA